MPEQLQVPLRPVRMVSHHCPARLLMLLAPLQLERLPLPVPPQTRTILRRNTRHTELIGETSLVLYLVRGMLTFILTRRAAYGYDVNDPAFQQWQASQTATGAGGDATASAAQQPPAAK